MNELDPTKLCFMYAFPATSPEDLGKERYLELEEMFNLGNYPSKEELQQLVPHACNRVEEWTVEGVRRYWWWGHQKLIASGREEYEHAPLQFKKQCSVRPGIIQAVSQEGVYEFQMRGEKTPEKVLIPRYLSNLIVGSHATVHLRRAVELITLEDYKKIKQI